MDSALVYTNNYRTIRAGTPLAATEYRRPDGSTVQMPGTGADVEAMLAALEKLGARG